MVDMEDVMTYMCVLCGGVFLEPVKLLNVRAVSRSETLLCEKHVQKWYSAEVAAN